MMLLILITIGLLYYFLIYKNNNIKQSQTTTVSCNSETDIYCKMYNLRDIQSKCERMCMTQDEKYVFSGEFNQKDNENICGCEIPIKNTPTEEFTNLDENVDILPDIIPDDSKFSNRDFLEKEQENRFNKLIFG